jgi:UMF1 family MFS transporter
MTELPHPSPAEPSAPERRFAAAAWVLLDWAASSFSTVLITLVVAYVEKIVFAAGGWGVAAGVIWAWTMAAAMLASAVLAPYLAALADRVGGHQRALVASVVAGSGGLLLLGIAPPAARLAVIACIVVACVGFDLAAIFTGSLLPRIASGRRADRLSAGGFAAGYAGGAIALVAATALVAAHERLGLTAAGGLRLAFAVTAAWWLLFSLPAAFADFGGDDGRTHAGTSTRELLSFARSLATGADGSRSLAAVLCGSTLALGAVQTAIAQFSSVALEEFHLEGPALVKLVLLVQAVALPGALAVGWLSARFGRSTALVACLAGWIAVLALAWFVQTAAQLHALAVLLALVLGGIQSVIRALVAGLAPAGRFGATFGLLQVGTKLAGFMASLLFGAMYGLTGSSRSGLLVLLAQLVVAWWALRGAAAPPRGGQASPITSRIE